MKIASLQNNAVKGFAAVFAALVMLGTGLPAYSQTGGGGAAAAPITQAEINAIADPTVKANAQARYDKAHTYTTQQDGVERPTDTNPSGRPRLFYSPMKLTAADCLTGRHWEMVGGYAGCVCDGDATHTRVSNDDAAACVIPPPHHHHPHPQCQVVEVCCQDSHLVAWDRQWDQQPLSRLRSQAAGR